MDFVETVKMADDLYKEIVLLAISEFDVWHIGCITMLMEMYFISVMTIRDNRDLLNELIRIRTGLQKFVPGDSIDTMMDSFCSMYKITSRILNNLDVNDRRMIEFVMEAKSEKPICFSSVISNIIYSTKLKNVESKAPSKYTNTESSNSLNSENRTLLACVAGGFMLIVLLAVIIQLLK